MKRLILFILIAGLTITLGVNKIKAEGENMSIQDGRKVSFDYTLTVEGNMVDSSEGKKPLQYIHGQNQIIPGLEKELTGLQTGEEKSISVPPQGAYGGIDPNAYKEVPKSSLPPKIKPEEGMMLALQGPQGQTMPAKIAEVKENSIVLNLNHPLAGKTLNFKVKIISVE